MKKILKIKIKEGSEKEFEDFCTKKDIFFNVYPLKIFKNVYKANAEINDFEEIEDIIISIEDMPIIIATEVEIN